MYKTIKLLLCLVLLLPYAILATQASAATNYNHEELMQYEGYGQAMYETIVDQTTFITGQYTDNKQYVNQSIDQIGDYAKFWLNEQGKLNDACKRMDLFTTNCLGELVSTGTGYLLTVGDWVKRLFNDGADEFSDFDLDAYKGLMCGTSARMYACEEGVKLSVSLPGYGTFEASQLLYSVGGYSDKIYALWINDKSPKRIQSDINPITISESFSKTNNFSYFFQIIDMFGVTIQFIRDGSEIKPVKTDKDYEKLKNYVNENDLPPIALPEPTAYLSCPDGTKINMAINGATFLDATGKVMQVNKNGTATVDSQICNLNWEKPKVDYIDDKAAITDKDGNWLDLLNGELLKCVLTDTCESLKPKDEVKPLDNSLIQYVKNAYDYATGTLKVATDGLKSLGNGAKGVTDLFGIFFSWLPKEIVVLMTGGLGIMIGLRIFRK